MLQIALNDLRLTFGDRAAVMWLLLFPIVFATFFGIVMGGGNGNPADVKASLTLVNEDGGVLATNFITELESQGLDLNVVTMEELALLENPYRTLVIPADFTTKVFSGIQVTLQLKKQPDTSEEAALLAQTRIIRAISRSIGRIITASASSIDTSIDANIDIKAISPEEFESVQATPDLVLVESQYAGRSEVIPSGFSQSIPGNTVMFVMLIALTYGAATLSGERQNGLLHRLATTPLSKREIIFGKILGRLVIASLQVTILVLVAFVAHLIFGIVIGNIFNVWIVLLVYNLCVAPLGVAFGAWFRDPERAANIGVILTMVMAALGGCWWPIEIVPASMQKLALIFPTTWAMKALHGVISFGRSLPELMLPLAVLLGFAIVFTAIAVRSLRIE